MKIVVLDGFTLNPGDLSWHNLKNIGQVTVYDRTKLNQIIDRIGDAEIVYTNKTPLTKATLEVCSSVKWIGVLATGYNVVDVLYARSKNIPVCNVPTYGTASVSQFVFALLLELCHQVGSHSETVKAGDWSNSKDFCYWNSPLVELAGKTMGIVGLGRIGLNTAKIGQAFGMHVIVYTNHQNQDLISEGLRYVTMEELFKESDVVSLHCPLFDSTKGMINKDTIAKMKDSVMVINTSRGQLIVEEDMKDALNNDQVAGFACDVVSIEPIRTDNPLLEAKNCIMTPHIAWAPLESRERLLDTAVNNLKSFLEGQEVNVVN